MSNFFGVQKTPATALRQAYIGKYENDTTNANTGNIFVDDFRLFNNSLDSQKTELVYYGQTLIGNIAPTNLRITEISNNYLRIQYMANRNATSYEIRTVPETSVWTTTDISYTLTGLQSMTPYTIYVFGVQADGKRSSAAKVCALEPPENISLSVTTANNIDMQYSAAFGANKYKISTSPETSTLDIFSTSSLLTGFSPDISYVVTISARDNSGGYSVPISNKVNARPPYILITNVTNTTVSLLYGAAPGATSYGISTVPSTVTYQTSSTSIDISGLTAGTPYTIYIQATDSSGTRSFYGSVSVSMPDGVYYKFDSGKPTTATPISGINSDTYTNSNGTYTSSSSSFSTSNNPYKAFDGSNTTVWENNTSVITGNINGNLGATYLSTTSLGNLLASGTDVSNLVINSCTMAGQNVRVTYTGYDPSGVLMLGNVASGYFSEYSPDTNKIYMFPTSTSGNAVIIYDVSTNTTSTSILGVSAIYRRITYAPNTKKMYTIISNASLTTQILVFDTVTNNSNYYDISKSSIAGNEWHNGVYVSSNQTIVYIPRFGTQILEFNTLNNSANYYGNFTGNQQFVGGYYSPATNKVYGIPYNYSYVCIFDCATKTITINGILTDTSGGWSSGMYVPSNGIIYGFPATSSSNNRWLKINPTAGTAASVPTLNTGFFSNTIFGVQSPYDNKIYCPPYRSGTDNSMVIVDVSNETYSYIQFSSVNTTNSTASTILTNNLDIYGIGTSNNSNIARLRMNSTSTAGNVSTTLVKHSKTTSTSTNAAYLTAAYDISFTKIARIELNVSGGNIYAYQSHARYVGNTSISLTESGINAAYENGRGMAPGSDGYGITNFNYTATQQQISQISYDSSGNYIGSNSTSVNTLGTVSGEWLQIVLPNSLKMTQYTIRSRTETPNEMPRIFTIAGSNNGTTWFPIDTQTVSASLSTPPTGATYTNNVITENPYSYYRIIVRNIYETRRLTAISEWNINYETSILANYSSGASSPTYEGDIQPFSISNSTYIRGTGSAYLDATSSQYITLPAKIYSSATPKFSAAMWVKIASNVRKPIFDMGKDDSNCSGAYSSMAVTGSALYWGAVAAPNNRIYFTPSDASNVLVIDPSTNTIFTSIPLGLTSGAKWGSSILAPNGKIYGIPRDFSSVIIVDPSTNTANTTTITGITGSNKYIGGAIAPNGKIYCPPYGSGVNNDNVLVINTNNDTVTKINTSGKTGWADAVLAPNGKIYGIPYSATSVMIIDPSTDTIDTSSIPITGIKMYHSGVLAQNGNIYCAPMDTSNVLIINPNTNTISFIAGLDSITTDKYTGIVSAPNGRLYGIPYNATNVLIIDPATNTTNTSTIGSISGSAKFGEGALAFNGNIYVAPYGATSVYVISPYMKSVGIDISNGYPQFTRVSHSNASTIVTRRYTLPVLQSASNNGWNHMGVSVNTQGQWTFYLNGLPYNTGIIDPFYFPGINNSNKYMPQKTYIGRYITDTGATNTSTVYIDDFRSSPNEIDFSYMNMLYQGNGFASPSSSPTNLTILDISSTSIRVSYTANAKAASYILRIVPETVSQVSTTSVDVRISGISPSPLTNVYSVYVYGVNSGGYLSPPAILYDSMKINANIAISVIDVSGTSANITYSPASGTLAKFEYTNDNTMLSAVTTSDTSYVVNNFGSMPNNVRVNTNGFYNITTVNVFAPTNLALTSVGDYYADITFTGNPANSYYEVQTIPASGNARIAYSSPFTITGLTTNTTYTGFMVRSVQDGIHYSAWRTLNTTMTTVQNRILNGNFSSPAIQDNNFNYYGYPDDNTSINNWISKGAALMNNSRAWGYPTPYPSPSQAISLQGLADLVTIRQNIYLVGGNYTLNLRACGRPTYIASPIKIDLSGNGTTTTIATFTPGNTWGSFSYSVTVPATNTYTLYFIAATTNTNAATAIDSVEFYR